MSVDFVKDIAFMPKGGTSSQGFIWTNGYIIHPADRTAARYIVKDIDGQKYLFMQWKSGDYVIRGERPWYYVLA
jgi:bla regulator protein BlaR1